MIPVANRPYKLLIVDDEPDSADLFSQRMRRDVDSGRYELLFASGGAEALELLQRVPDVDLVITDINMPEMDGLSLLEQIPEVQPDLRSVILSAYGDMHNIRTAMNRGAFDFVTKPVDFQDLRSTIERCLAHLQEWRDALASRDQLVTLQRDLDIASRMQRDILPCHLPQDPFYSVHGIMQPARTVAGDFYDVVALPDGRVALLIADVSGKGVPAAMMMMSSRTLLRGALLGVDDPGQVLQQVNGVLREHNRIFMFVTVFLGVYDPADGRLVYANAGHLPPLVASPEGAVIELDLPPGVALGLTDGRSYPSLEYCLPVDHLLFAYTDGVSEAVDELGCQFGEERLRALVAARSSLDLPALVDAVVDAVHDHSGDAPPFDDLTCLALHRRSGVLR